jgi:1-deoxy-D-xylulose 5-phosphate reductoisomerase
LRQVPAGGGSPRFRCRRTDELDELTVEQSSSGPSDQIGTLITVDGFGTVMLTNFTGTLTAADVMFI